MEGKSQQLTFLVNRYLGIFSSVDIVLGIGDTDE